jgi:chemotaxis protein CheD
MLAHVKHYLLPGGLFATREPHLVQTVLGSCVSVCLIDPQLGYAGINHFMLPVWKGDGLASPKYGNVAMDELLRKMLSMGCSQHRLVAKVFGGSDLLHNSYKIGDRNVEVALHSLEQQKITVVARSVGGKLGRKLVLDTQSGGVSMHLINNTRGAARPVR